VDSTTGIVTLLSTGITTITIAQALTTIYNSSILNITLNVT
jgi:hypothetical protein